MKKLIVILLIVTMLISSVALACEEDTGTVSVLRVNETAYTPNTFHDPAWWPLTEDHVIAGIKDYGERLEREGVQHVSGMYVAGNIEHGWMRFAKEIRTVNVNGNVVGLTLLTNTTITIYEEYLELAEAVVHDLLGCDTEMNQNSLVAGATWWNGDYASLIFHPSYSDRFEIGYVTFNSGRDTTPFYLGHFNGVLRFGLSCGWWIPDPEPIAEPDPEPEEEPTNNNTVVETNVSTTATATSQASVNVSNSGSINNSGDGCYRNNVVIQVNIGSFVKNCIRFLKECVQ